MRASELGVSSAQSRLDVSTTCVFQVKFGMYQTSKSTCSACEEFRRSEARNVDKSFSTLLSRWRWKTLPNTPDKLGSTGPNYNQEAISGALVRVRNTDTNPGYHSPGLQ